MTTAHTNYDRDGWNAIVMTRLPAEVSERVKALVKSVSEADKVDEHGGWNFGIESLTRRRSRALNWDLYGFGTDMHSDAFLAVIQVREWTEGRRYNTVRKSYFLIGENEDKTVFAHPVESRVVHAAVKADRDVVLACQNWIFGGDYAAMLRQGDIALIPLKKAPAADKLSQRVMVLEGSHRLKGTQLRQNGHLYVRNPDMVHIPDTHPAVSAKGWHRVVIGKRSRFWNFAVPTVD